MQEVSESQPQASKLTLPAASTHTSASPGASFSELLEQSERLVEERLRDRRSAVFLSVGALLSLIPYFVLMFTPFGSSIVPAMTLTIGIISVFIFGGTLNYGSREFLRRLNRPIVTDENKQHLAHSLSSLNDARTLVPLIDCMHFRCPRQIPGLTERLWGVMPEDALLVDEPRRSLLRRELKRHAKEQNLHPSIRYRQSTPLTESDADFLIGTMKALATVGDQKALPLLRRWSKGRLNDENGAIVQGAAREFLRVLQEKIQQRQADRSPNVLRRDLPANVAGMEPGRAIVLLGEVLISDANAVRTMRKFSLSDFVFPVILLFFFLSMVRIENPAQFIFLILLAGYISVMGRGAGNLFSSQKKSAPADNNVSPFTRDVATELMKFRSKYTLRPLLDTAETVRWSPGTFSSNLQETLVHLLHSLEPGDGVFLTKQNRRYLRNLLQNHPSGTLPSTDKLPVSLVSAAVYALGVVRDPKALPVIEKLHRDTDDPELRQVTAECLKRLRDSAPIPATSAVQ
ncbi:MAG: hypothetical protein OHK0029_11830 [Armatimonadaceae bacterium]